MDLEQLVSNRQWDIGDKVYINTPGGIGGNIFAYVLYETHIEYMVRTKDAVLQLEEASISDTKIIEY